MLEKWGPTVTLNDEAAPTRADMSAEDTERLAAVRARLAELMGAWTDTGYKVCMECLRCVRGGVPCTADGCHDTTHIVVAVIRVVPQYTGQVYREIAMENSDYGGMENVGNTTGASPIAPCIVLPAWV